MTKTASADVAAAPEAVPASASASAASRDSAVLRQRRESLDVSRRVLAQFTGLSESRIWAAEQDGKEVSAEHLVVIDGALDEIGRSGLPEHLKPARVTGGSARQSTTRIITLTRRLHDITDVLGEARNAKTVKDMRSLVERALVLAGPGGDAAAEAGSADEAAAGSAQPA